MANTFAVELAALSPDHSWPMGEAAGSYLDEVGSLDMAENAVGSIWRQSPGLIRNAPFEYGVWGSAQVNGRYIISPIGNVPAATGWNTGVINCFMMLFDTQDGIFTPFSVGGGNGVAAASSVRFEVLTNGVLRFIVGATSGNRIYSSTAAGVISLGVPYMITGIQRGDGTGLHILVNGVDVTDSTNIGGTGTLDSFIGDLFSGGVASHITVNGQQTVGAQGGRAIVQRPAIWRNVVFSDAAVLALYTSGNLDGSGQDYYEYCLENFVVPGNTKWWWPGWLNSAFIPVDAGTNGRGATGTDMAMSNMGTINIAETDRVTAYDNYKNRFQGSTNASLTVPELSGFNTGTVNLLLTFQNVPTSIEKFVLGIGAFGTGKMTVCFDGFTLGYRFTVTLGEVNLSNVLGTNGFQMEVLPADGGIPVAGFIPGLFTMFTIVQDGVSGVQLYRDGELITDIAESTNGAGWDQDSWWNDIPTSGDVLSLGYAGSASTNNFVGDDLNDLLLLPGVALNSLEVSDLWDAVNGIFAPVLVPPDDGFNATLVETGNEADPNGPGPDHYWRMNAAGAGIADVGISVIDGTSIGAAGDPEFRVPGPLINDPSNFAIYLDGQGDYFEIGVDGIAGELVTFAIGTVGFFISVNDLATDNVIYSQANDLGTERIQWGVNAGFIEFFLQISAGNSITVRSSILVEDFDFVFVVMTNDGADYRLYVQGAIDPLATLSIAGVGVSEGDWFDDITATRSAVGALANSLFTTNANERPSEIFIYKVVLSETQITALFEAAVGEGLLGSPALLGVLEFDNVTFKNGGLADLRAINGLSDFAQVVNVKQSSFSDGLQDVNAQAVLLSGIVRGNLKSNSFILGATPVIGRAAIVGTAAVPNLPTTLGTLIASKNTFNGMGAAAKAAIYLEAAFGATVVHNRFYESVGGAIAWGADTRRLVVAKNLIDTVTAAIAAIYSFQGLNANIGTGWLVDGNTILDIATGGGIRLTGLNSSASQSARNVNLRGNKIATVATAAIFMTRLIDVLAQRNEINGGTNAIEADEVNGVLALRRNRMEGYSGDAISVAPSALQALSLVIDRNTVDGVLNVDGITIDNVTQAILTNNKLLNLVNGLTIGALGAGLKLFGNQMPNNVAPLTYSAGVPTGLEIGRNQVASLGDASTLTVAAEAIAVVAPKHFITAALATDLVNLSGFGQEGFTVMLQLAAGSSTITLRSTGDMTLASDFVMNTPGEDQIWLAFNSTGWEELSRFTGSP